MNLYVKNHGFNYELENLCRVFFPNEKIIVLENTCEICDDNFVLTELKSTELGYFVKVRASFAGNDKSKETFIGKDENCSDNECERIFAINLFEILTEITGIKPSWGVLTGVRPVKLMRNLMKEFGDIGAQNYFSDSLFVTKEKTDLAYKIAKTQEPIISLSTPKSFSLYVSIPFCPSRCSYCSFVSHSVEKSAKLIPEYIVLLKEELEFTANIVKKLGLKLETVYIGGGTPTTLSASQLRDLIEKINLEFDVKSCREFTVEAGRPDTITKEKLLELKRLGVTRISINPQTLNDEILDKIGRKHTAKQTIDAFNLARNCGFDNINMDLIAGLPGETFESFKSTLNKIIELDPENVTVHTLALKRSSGLNGEGKQFSYDEALETEKMLNISLKSLTDYEYHPYYLYRQSKMLGNFENIGYCKSGYENLYNIYIMEEIHSIISCGAGGVTKLKNPYGSEIERIFNFKFAYEYKERFSEMKNRKNKVLTFYDNLEKALPQR